MRIFRQPAFWMALGCITPNTVHAQIGQSGQIGSYNRPRTNTNPTISPYLNLDRGGNPAVNFYGLVRPQIDANRAFQQLDPALFGGDPRLGFGAGGAAVGPDGNPIPGATNYLPNQAFGLNTGHQATFFYYSHYYQFPAGQRGGAGSGAGANTGAFGRPNSQAIPFFAGGNGVILPINPSGANPLGGQGLGINQPLAPGIGVMQ